MSEPIEDRLRTHFAGKAAQVQVAPDPDALMERSVGRTGSRRPLAVAAVAIAVVFAASGVLTGVNLTAGRSSTTSVAAAPSAGVPGRVGASLAPGPSGGPELPATAVQTPYAFLFSRTTPTGVTIRAYGTAGGTTGVCTDAASCPPVGVVPGPVPCPKGAMCAQPAVVPQGQAGGTGSAGTTGGAGASAGGAVGTPVTGPTQPAGSGSTGSGSGSTGSVPTGTAPSPTPTGCGQLVVELSTGEAVGSGSVLRPTTAPPTADTVALLGEGSFGVPEGAPVGWVAVWVGSDVASVHLTSGGTVVDAMAPDAGLVVLAVPGTSDLSGATVVGVDQGGAAVATVPADQSTGPDVSAACTTSPTTTTTTTVPTTTPTTTTPTTEPTTTTTLTTPTTPTTTASPVPTRNSR